MPFITFLCLIIFVCILMGDDGFKIMGVVLAFGVVAGVILGIITIPPERLKKPLQDKHDRTSINVFAILSPF